MTTAGGDTSVECGFCLRRDGDMDDPRKLPCNHIHCMDCLTAQFHSMNVVKCPLAICKRVFDVKLERLPSAESESNLNWCDVCVKKQVKMAATTYCVQCTKKYCDKHIEWHDDMFEDHPKVAIDSYKAHALKMEIRTCNKHRDLPYVRGCRHCLSVFCVECVYGLDVCSDGKPHKLLPLDDLVGQLKTEIHELTAILIDKEGKLADLSKQTARYITGYTYETQEMVERIRKTRDEQIAAIQEKYEKLEKELVELRRGTEVELNEFMEHMVNESLAEVNITRLRINNKLNSNHQVDLVKEHTDIKSRINTLIHQEFPSLELANVRELRAKVESRDIELGISSKEVTIASESGKPHVSTPKSLTLLRTVPLPSHCRSVFHFGTQTFTGHYNETLSQIDASGSVTHFVKLGGGGDCVIVHRERIYVLSVGQRAVIIVYDMAGKIIMSWAHDDGGPFNKMAIVKNLVIVPDRVYKRLITYSLNGRRAKSLPCELLNNGHLCMCALANNSVVISDYKSGKVFRVDVETGQVMWTFELEKAEGVTSYGDDYICVASEACNIIKVLHADNGTLVSELNSPEIGSGLHVFDLHITGNTLIVPTYGPSGPVLFYEING